MRKSGLTGDEAYVLSKHGKTTEDLGPLKKEIGLIKEDIEEITTKDYVNLLESSDVISIETVKGFPHPEYEPKKIKTINMSDVNNTVCELHIKLNTKANRKYLLSTLVSVKAGVGKVTVLFYDVETYSNIFNIYGDSVTYNGKLIGNSIDEKTTNIIGGVGTTKDGIVTARLRFESIDKTLIAEYSEMSLIDITDFSEDITKLNKYINMTYAERFDLKPKGVSLETKKELEKNLSESKIYTDTKITSLKQYPNYLYGKKWWAVGDSITFGARSDIDENGVRKTYATYIANRNGMVLKLDAISGRAMGVKENRTDSFCLNGYYDNCPFDYPDYITIFLGTNDTEEVGTIDSTDINTFSGGYNKVLDYLTATYPRAKIGIIPVYDLAEQRGQMTIALGEKWGVPVFNWDTHSFFYYRYQHNTVKERKQKEFMYFDGTRYEVHPIDAGYQFMSTMIESWMREL
jgi:lysophospholipase L1-like esterase